MLHLKKKIRGNTHFIIDTRQDLFLLVRARKLICLKYEWFFCSLTVG